MKKILISSLAVAGLLFIVSCNTEFDTDVKDVKVTNGTADFTKYVALGNSLTSGYRDGALYLDGQNESYPSMIAQQMKLAGGAANFNQPLMDDNNGGLLLPTPAGNVQIFDTKLYISGFSGGVPVLGYANNRVATNVLKNIYTSSNTFQNLGVPGAKSFHLLYNGFGNPSGIAAKTANPYYVRFASSPTATVVGDALAQNPTFFSLWIGNNDTLGYASNGGDVTLDQMTPITDFTAYYSTIINTMVSKGAKGVVANLPYVTSIPFFTTVPYNPLTSRILGKGDVAVGEKTIDDLNAGLYGPLNQILTALGAGDRIKPLSKTSGNPVLMIDETLPDLSAQIKAVASTIPTLAPLATYLGATYGRARQAKSTDMILLSTQNAIGGTVTLPPGVPATLGANGVSYPFADKYVLLPSEATEINSTIDSYNAAIKSIASSKGLAFVDANSKMKELSQSSGIQFDGVRYTAKFVTGGTFSLDGVHLTGRGYAVIANEFIKAINNKYGSTLPMVNPNGYSGVKFP